VISSFLLDKHNLLGSGFNRYSTVETRRTAVDRSAMLKSREQGMTALKSKVIAATLIVMAVALVLAVVAGDVIEDALVEGSPINLPLLTSIFSYIVSGSLSVIIATGYYGVFTLMILESSSLPILSEVILPFSGYLASQGHLNVWLIIVAATIAGLAGSLIDYLPRQFAGA
jgi:hypothetical protein